MRLACGAGGVLLAGWGLDLLRGFQPPFGIPLVFDFSLDGRVLGFALLLSLLCGVAAISETLLTAQTWRRRLLRGAGVAEVSQAVVKPEDELAMVTYQLRHEVRIVEILGISVEEAARDAARALKVREH